MKFNLIFAIGKGEENDCIADTCFWYCEISW